MIPPNPANPLPSCPMWDLFLGASSSSQPIPSLLLVVPAPPYPRWDMRLITPVGGRRPQGYPSLYKDSPRLPHRFHELLDRKEDFPDKEIGFLSI